MLTPLIASLAAFVSVGAAILWMGGVRRPSAEARLAALATGALPSHSDEASFSDRVMSPLFGGLVRFLMGLLPHSLVERTSQQLITAGRPLTTQAFFTIVFVMGGLLPFSIVVFSLMGSDGSLSTQALIAALVLCALGVVLPFGLLRRRIRARRSAIWKSLPDAFDMITISVEAGLGLDAALRQVAEKFSGPLSDEIKYALRQIGMGRGRREALEELAERGDVKELVTFVHAIIQAETLGTSLGRVLRAQSMSIRIQRRQRAEEISRKAPVKMAFPLVLFMMPTFFIITLGPMFIRLAGYLGN